MPCSTLLIYVKGENGYHLGINHVHPETRHPTKGKAVSCMAYYAYHFMVWPESFNHLLRYRDLFHQFTVDHVCEDRVRETSLLQDQPNTAACGKLHPICIGDSINNNRKGVNISQLCILPSTFTRGLRYMHEEMQDAMTYVGH